MKRISHVEIWGGSIPGRSTSEFESKEVRKTCSLSEEQKGGWQDGSKVKEEVRSDRFGHGLGEAGTQKLW